MNFHFLWLWDSGIRPYAPDYLFQVNSKKVRLLLHSSPIIDVLGDPAYAADYIFKVKNKEIRTISTVVLKHVIMCVLEISILSKKIAKIW